MNISKITKEILEKILGEIKKDENMHKIHSNLIDPLVGYTFTKIYPYVLVIFIFFILMFLVALIILLLLIRTQFFK